MIPVIPPDGPVDKTDMFADTQEPPAHQSKLPLAERTFQAFATQLWPWTGWYALVIADRFVGVFPTLWEAITAAQAGDTDPGGVLVRRIGADAAAPTPIADGCPLPAAPPWSV